MGACPGTLPSARGVVLEDCGRSGAPDLDFLAKHGNAFARKRAAEHAEEASQFIDEQVRDPFGGIYRKTMPGEELYPRAAREVVLAAAIADVEKACPDLKGRFDLSGMLTATRAAVHLAVLRAEPEVFDLLWAHKLGMDVMLTSRGAA